MLITRSEDFDDTIFATRSLNTDCDFKRMESGIEVSTCNVKYTDLDNVLDFCISKIQRQKI